MCACAVNDMTLDESSCDAAEVLIRSTTAVSAQKGQKTPDVNIYVQRLSDSTVDGFLEEVLPVNTHSASATAPTTFKQHTASKPVFGGAMRGDERQQLPRRGRVTLKQTVTQTSDNKQEEQDVLISRYPAHGRGAVVEALKHRSHSAPVRREVKVQLLDAGRPQSSAPRLPEVQTNAALSSQDAGATSAAAAFTAAAIAATAPLVKAQSDTEACVAQVASEVRQLQEVRVLTQHRLQHLETIQGQQLELQNRLLGSALDAVTARTIPPSQSTLHTVSGITLPESVHRSRFSRLHVVGNAAAGASVSTAVQEQSGEIEQESGKDSLEILAPRNVIPKPTHWNRSACSNPNRTQKPAQPKHVTFRSENDETGSSAAVMPHSAEKPFPLKPLDGSSIISEFLTRIMPV